ncbi:MAG: hypothetical protein KVP17_004497 [Porospora cf. gigantea B]|uniref:uncharacterized protein n=1 Tax=Porospora cf. gigantea B TaxID=2853592 RepID=UPI003571EBCF|nr:MAG: hypothetical protein KVP17_004497 [Porospora cf. gigantea B]
MADLLAKWTGAEEEEKNEWPLSSKLELLRSMGKGKVEADESTGLDISRFIPGKYSVLVKLALRQKLSFQDLKHCHELMQDLSSEDSSPGMQKIKKRLSKDLAKAMLKSRL